MDDPENELVHQVYRDDLLQYEQGMRTDLSASCGKVWSPSLPIDTFNKPRCNECFPPRPKFAIAV
jgi:hypothetical protein